jgi:hypothetical protein
MTAGHDLLRPGFTDPNSLTSLTLRDWDLLIRQGRNAGVLGRIQAVLEDRNLLETVPVAPRHHLNGARILATSQEQVIRWEIRCIERALLPTQTEFVLLKGAAYVISQFPFARGRIQSDIDILVPESKLKAAEAALLDAGWVHVKLDKYDQAFYRKFSHELPPTTATAKPSSMFTTTLFPGRDACILMLRNFSPQRIAFPVRNIRG